MPSVCTIPAGLQRRRGEQQESSAITICRLATNRTASRITSDAAATYICRPAVAHSFRATNTCAPSNYRDAWRIVRGALDGYRCALSDYLYALSDYLYALSNYRCRLNDYLCAWRSILCSPVHNDMSRIFN
ncbi:hypothetical protein ACXR0O_04445 [Verrucomicrobiota bacterium sgz303538]